MLRHRVLVAVTTLVLITAGCATIAPHGTHSEVTPERTTSPTGSGVREPGSRAGVSYSELYDRTIDSVVEITVLTPAGQQSLGSGFVYSEAGYIVTNQHVVGESESVTVRFRDGTWRVGTVVGRDVYTDLAVVRVESLPPGVDALELAEDPPHPGQPVVALGSPFGFEGSIMHGIVSGVNRSMPTARGFSIPATIQTDAPINPGNSGGPLVTMNGTVVGVNRAKTGDNVGFAISAAVVREVVPALIEDGEYQHAFLGVGTVPVTPRIAAANDIARARGVMVVDTLRGGPAAGELRSARLVSTESGRAVYVGGDIIVSIEGTAIPTQQALARYLLLHTHPGESVSLTVVRDGRARTVTVELGRRPELRVDDGV